MAATAAVSATPYKVGIKWLREIPNELLYLPICSFLENNPSSYEFYIFCPSNTSRVLFEAFLNRLFGKNHSKPIYLIVGFNDIDESITIIPEDTIFIGSAENANAAATFFLDSDFFKDLGSTAASLQYLKKLSYSLEEYEFSILRFGNNMKVWDKFYAVWNSQSPSNYYWRKYVGKYMNIESGLPCFSFCLYGNSPKYIQGFINNIPLVKKHFPDFAIALWIRSDSVANNLASFISKMIEAPGDASGEVPGEVPGEAPGDASGEVPGDLDKFMIFEIQNSAHIYMTRYRIYMINHWYPTQVYCRDADSRIGERDAHCIVEFQKSGKGLHIIRDHYWHKSKIMAGTCGIICKYAPFFPALFENWLKPNILADYGTDEKFLQEIVYSQFTNNLFIHTNIVAYADEETHPIPHEFMTTDCTDFIGNCYEANDAPQFKYWDFPVEQHADWLCCQSGGRGGAERILLELSRNPRISQRLLRNKNMLSKLTRFAIDSGDLRRARELFAEFEWIPTVDEGTLRNLVVPFYERARKDLGTSLKLIATTDTNRRPCADDPTEEIICVGNYPYGVWNLPGNSRRICLPLMFYNILNDVGTVWEYEPCWQRIDRIYVLNLEERVDRWVATLSELASMGAPLNRIYHYKAKKAEIATKLEIYAGATKNHVDCVRDFVESGLGVCLVLEDDIQFCSDLRRNKETLSEFFRRQYDYGICMISYSKIGPIEPKDDLVFLSRQSCTTSSGYLLCKETAAKIHGVLEEGLRKMRETGDYITYCCDRYWAKIQCDGKFLLLRNKIAFQRIVYSNITGCNNLYLD